MLSFVRCDKDFYCYPENNGKHWQFNQGTFIRFVSRKRITLATAWINGLGEVRVGMGRSLPVAVRGSIEGKFE